MANPTGYTMLITSGADASMFTAVNATTANKNSDVTSLFVKLRMLSTSAGTGNAFG